MRLRNRIASAVAVTAVAGVAFAGTANAAPDFSDCPRTAPGAAFCLDVRSTAGTLRINRTEIPLGGSLEIRGAAASFDEEGFGPVVGPAGGSSLFSDPVEVPGGLVRGATHPLNRVTVQFKAVGEPELNQYSFDLRVPVKIKLKSPSFGTCRLGTDAAPIVLNLTLTEFGHVDLFPTYFVYNDTRYADTTFAVPATRGCGSIVNALVDWRFGLPSASGSNALTLTTEVGATFAL